jgi:hypothetical protein
MKADVRLMNSSLLHSSRDISSTRDPNVNVAEKESVNSIPI